MTATEKPHIVRSFDEELESMSSLLLSMGEKAQQQLEKATQALRTRDLTSAQAILRADDIIDSLHAQVNTLSIGMLATRQPMATDLRHIVAGLKIATDLERVADYAASVAGNTLALPSPPPWPIMEKIDVLVNAVLRLLAEVLRALRDEDEPLAMQAWKTDDAVDSAYLDLLHTLQQDIAANPENLSLDSQLLFIARNLERMGDHVTNVAGHLIYSISGQNAKIS